MADNNPSEPLVSQKEKDNSSDSSQSKVDTLVPTLLILFTGSGMCISGLAYALMVFNIKGFLWGFFLLAVISGTYWVNHRIISRACSEAKESSYSKLIHHHWGRKRGITIQIAMAVHNIIIIAYLQQRIAANAFFAIHEGDSVLQYTDAFYYVAIANIPLILLALQSSFERIRWFAIIGILVWTYLFIGVITEGFSSEEIFASTGSFFPDADVWMLTSIGLLAYFMSSFQIIPYLHGEVKHCGAMKSVINNGAIGSIVLVFTVFMYFSFSQISTLNFLRHCGLALIGSCVTIINVLPTREFIVQILQEKAKDKQKTRDRFITLFVLSATLFLSIFFVDVYNWQVFVGIGTILTSLLGFVFPAVLFFKIAKHDESKKKIAVLVWNVILAAVIFAAGVVMITVEPCQNIDSTDCGIL